MSAKLRLQRSCEAAIAALVRVRAQASHRGAVRRLYLLFHLRSIDVLDGDEILDEDRQAAIVSVRATALVCGLV